MIIRTLMLILFLVVTPAKPMNINDIKLIVHMLPVCVPSLFELTSYTSENFALKFAFDVMHFPYDSNSFGEAYIRIMPPLASTMIALYPWVHNQVANFHTGNSSLTTKVIITWSVLSYALFFNAFMLWRHNRLNATTSTKLIAHCVLIYGLPFKYLWSL